MTWLTRTRHLLQGLLARKSRWGCLNNTLRLKLTLLNISGSVMPPSESHEGARQTSWPNVGRMFWTFSPSES